jgi:rhodanese-related sulfurtransferase
MEPPLVNPLEAFAVLDRDPTASYVDVRAVAEFAAGHPKSTRVVNVPSVFFHPTTGETHVNDSFLLVMNDIFAKGARLILGADNGERAVTAATVLLADGFTGVSAMAPGLAAWARHNLPTTADNRPGVSYVSLLTAARRRK